MNHKLCIWWESALSPPLTLSEKGMVRRMPNTPDDDGSHRVVNFLGSMLLRYVNQFFTIWWIVIDLVVP
jgi:hypothetical protein